MPAVRVSKTYFMLVVADMERAVRFYTDALGGELAVSSPGWSEVNVAGATVALHAGGVGADTPTGLGFEVDDIDSAVSAVVAAGGHVIDEPQGGRRSGFGWLRSRTARATGSRLPRTVS